MNNSSKSITEHLKDEETTPPDYVLELTPQEKVGWQTKLGIYITMFLIGLYTIMDSVLYIPIANELNSLPKADWIINGYMITTTALQPIYGKGSDIVGRKAVIITATALLLAGSVMCALAQSIEFIIASRAIQGLGSAGIYTTVNVIIADLFSERERARFMGIASCIWGISIAVGVVLGGVVTQLSTWRVAFWINVPIAVIIALISWKNTHLPPVTGTAREKLRRMDFGGSALCLASIVLILLGLSWGGRDYPWASAAVLCCLILGIIIGFLFVYYEHKVPVEPIFPLRLLKQRNVAIALVGHLFFGAITYAPTMFIPQWALLVKNTTPITSGLYTLPFTITESVFVMLAGIWVNKSGRYRECVWLGSCLLLAGLTPLVILDQNTGLGKVIGFQFIAGIGFGLCIQTLILTGQASAPGSDVASTTSTCLFMRSLGGILVVAVLSSVNGNVRSSKFSQLTSEFPNYTAEISKISMNQSLIHKLDIPVELFNQLVSGFMLGMRAAFIALIPFSALFVLVVLGIKHISLEQSKKL
ncbi:MFS general substrate transporter [Coemansia reversa NRRL 1564]|uniref:MFS general substrate transporter n=1 Tax=Coemansia reversa (strain ATCC 12441 / NRRL 1564) TaxID=763665 RepID=A0A2G5BGN1_COERN|nr:MFS general substrate transporter [Coemansia reversa NRRL 1564]|eukprot:PIA18151.1 MFS general substrate transporter [Coemansia reversa NRRL 1564]